VAVYAIVRTGGKQYRVEAGDTIYVERLETTEGSQISLDEVLVIGGQDALRVGAPYLSDAKVVGTVLKPGRESKIRVFKYKKRKQYRRTRGHRQSYTALRIDSIQA
jgi:large subunit ribosomal protein L21